MTRELFATLYRKVTLAVLERLLKRCERKRRTHRPVTKRLLYVPASSLPYHISGYTTRTHEVILAMGEAGADVRVVTRPGYPWDRGDRVQDTDATTTPVDNVTYEHVRSPSKHRPLLLFAAQAAREIERIAARDRVETIHAASNHENALPALLAARRLGILFQYEMRGLWELTRASRIPGYENSADFLSGLEFEGFVAGHADRVFVISEQLEKFARQRWKIPAERFALLPNCVDPDRFPLRNPQNIEPRKIGYAGSLICYEGLDTLIDAIEILGQQGVDVRLDIIGDGEARSQLEEHAGCLGLTDRIRFVGRVSPHSSRDILASSALVCIPREPYKVCRIVPPIKLVEALALGKPVVVPDLPVFRDELRACPVAWFFKSGDASHLANILEKALADRDAICDCAVPAREYVAVQRSWQKYVTNVVSPGGIDARKFD